MTSRVMVKCCVALLLLLTVVPLTSVAEAYWTPKLKIDEGDGADYPEILVDPSGNAIVQWSDDPEWYEDPRVIRAIQYNVDTGWDPFELLERSDVNPTSKFDFVQDLNGNIIAYWREYDGSRWWIHTSRMPAGGSWSVPEIIDTGDRGDSDGPRITMNPAGNAIMMWRQTVNKKIYIYARMYIPETGWQESVRVLEGINSWSGVRITANGYAIFLYENDDTNMFYAKRYEPGTGWGAAEQIDMGTGTAYSPRVEMDPSGNAIAVWKENDGVQLKIYARRFEVGTGWGVDERIDMDTGTVSGGSVGMDPSGNATVVWTENDGTQINTYARRFEVGTGWGTAQGYGDGYTSIAMDSSGNVITVWKDYVVDKDVIYTNIYKVGIGWGTPELMWTASDTDSYYIMSFEINSDGDAVLVWLNYNYGGLIYANCYSPETGWDTPELIGSERSFVKEHRGPIATARAVIDERGNAIAIWRYYEYDLDNPIEIIYSKQYKPGEGWMAAQARVTYNPWYRFGRYDIPERPVIAMNPIGDAFLVWIRFGMVAGMEHMYSINAARYVAEVPPACEGDFDSNGDVDEADLAVFAADFGRSDCGSGPACEGDFNTNNNVDGSDLAIFAADFGRTDCP